jgi:hypothetical protein
MTTKTTQLDTTNDALLPAVRSDNHILAHLNAVEDEYADVDFGDMDDEGQYVPSIKLGRKCDGTGGFEVGSGERVMEIDIVLAKRGTSRILFDGDYNPNDKKPPLCRSSDGAKPDARVANPVSTSCHGCPMSFEAGGSCKKSSEVMGYLPDGDDEGVVRFARIRFGGMAASAFMRYWTSFKNRMPVRPPISYITHVTLEPKPTLNGNFLVPHFSRLRGLSRAELEVFHVDSKKRTAEWRHLIETDDTLDDEATVKADAGPFDDGKGVDFTWRAESVDPETGEITDSGEPF